MGAATVPFHSSVYKNCNVFGVYGEEREKKVVSVTEK
jgi:hypothetical protein